MTPSSGNGSVTYTVERKLGAGLFAAIGSGSCSGSLPRPTASCTDTVGVSGTYTYRVVAHFLTAWTATSNEVSVTVNTDSTPPYVTSLNRADNDPTNAGTVHWTLSFSESVTGVDSSDFALTSSGVTGAAITGVTGSGSGPYTITVTTGTNSGTLGLNLVDNNSITDGAANPLGDSVGGPNGNFTGQAYAIDKTGPTVTVNQRAGQADPTNALPILWTVTFSESVTDFDASDLTRGGITTGGAVSVSGGGSSYEISLSGSPTNGTTSFTIGAGVATDALGNGNTTSTSTDNTVTYDTVAPSVAVTGVNGATRTFPYSTNVDVTSISGTCGTASGDLTAVNWSIGLRSGSATCSAGTWASGTFAAISADGTYTADATQADAAGNTGNATDRTVIVDKTAPSVAVTGVNGATRTFPYSTNVDVTSISGTCGTASGDLTAVNWSIGLRSGSATCSAGTWASGTFAAISADGTYTADATQADAAGNTGNATDRTVIVDKTAPSVAVTGVNGATRTFPYSTNVDVTSISERAAPPAAT